MALRDTHEILRHNCRRVDSDASPRPAPISSIRKKCSTDATIVMFHDWMRRCPLAGPKYLEGAQNSTLP
jgi:hypothetical protein